MSRAPGALYVGIDLGTSGCRALAIDTSGTVQAEATTRLPPPRREGRAVEQDPALWWDAVEGALDALLERVPRRAVRALAVDATSGSVLLADAEGTPLSPGLMYNDARALEASQRIAAVAPPTTAAHGTGSGLAKLLWLQGHVDGPVRWVLNQGDWIGGRLSGRFGISDANNCLKLGYDPLTRTWPAWLDELGVPRGWLPDVLPPGRTIAPLAPPIAAHFGLTPNTVLVSGTTDSTAAFLATGAREPGEAVTSLGSTLVLKIVAERPLFYPPAGVYSQPLGERWLAGGGSNAGGAVLLHYFDRAALEALTPRLRPHAPTGLDYYPLLAPGERFPRNDPQFPPRLTPRPEDEAVFLQGMLEGMARIEAEGYARLAELGAPPLRSVRSIGGGARNPAWREIRARALGVPLLAADNEEAAYGAALLARAGSP
ncbi:FGGY-family carbohydrate kinase [Ectothiorhodospiraceae bacterium 2226]|nr:FGGY-family carbohydrate kinase [Ectothiorhodospiraceae bacterium 2226]